MQQIEFYKLSRAVQDRFIDTSRGASAPSPLLSIRHRPTTAYVWAVIAAVLLLAAITLVRTGYGNLESSQGIAPASMLVVYVLLLAALAISLLVTALALRAPRLFPYVPAIYLFPVGVIDTTSPTFRLYSLDELDKLQVEGTTVVLRFKGGKSFSFSARNKDQGETVRQTLEDARIRLAQAETEMNRRDLALLDPLRDTGFSNPFSPKTARLPPRQRSAWLLGLPLCVFLGGLLGWQTWQLRNAWSERALYDAAQHANTPEAYRNYLRRGGTRSEVRDILLPRAELREAQRANNVEAIDRYMASHPNSKIQAEVSAARRAALLTQLDAAKKAGTVSALRDFAARYKNYDLVRAEYDAALAAVYRKAFEEYRKKHAPANDGIVGFVARLLDFSRVNGPRVEVRFRRIVKESLTHNDDQLLIDRYSRGAESLPGQYFDERHTRPREERAGQGLIAQWGRAFPKDILDMKLGPPVPNTDEALPEVKVPTLFIEHAIGGAGIFRTRDPRGIFVGVGFVFNSTFAIPGQKEALTFRSSLWRTPDSDVLKKEGGGIKDVYDNMAVEGFDSFLKQYANKHFQKSS